MALFSIIIYNDTGNHILSKPQQLSHERIRDIAQEEFDECVDDANEFLVDGYAPAYLAHRKTHPKAVMFLPKSRNVLG